VSTASHSSLDAAKKAPQSCVCGAAYFSWSLLHPSVLGKENAAANFFRSRRLGTP